MGSTSLQKRSSASTGQELVRYAFMVVVLGGLVFATFYCAIRSGDLHQQMAVLKGCPGHGNTVGCTDGGVNQARISALNSEADDFGMFEVGATIAAVIAFIGLVLTLFREAADWLRNF